jgi:hypothetical protein
MWWPNYQLIITIELVEAFTVGTVGMCYHGNEHINITKFETVLISRISFGTHLNKTINYILYNIHDNNLNSN